MHVTITLLYAILASILAVIVTIIFEICKKENTKQSNTVLIIALILIMIILPIAIGYLEKKDAYIKALKGNNPYKMEINYLLKDSVYVPCDTTYVLKTKE